MTDDAVAALERLGLASNEAKLLLGLQRLGSATARDLSEVTGVPRSQVYGTAERLEERGLVYVQHATPKRYQSIDSDEVEAILRERFERDLETAVDNLERLEREAETDTETREEIWTIRGREAIDQRIEHLTEGASQRIVFGVSAADLLSADQIELLRDRAAAGVEVLVISRDAAVRDRFAGIDGIEAVEPPASIAEGEQTGRVLIVDDESILHSVIGKGEPLGIDRETAFWSRNSGFARMVITLIKETIEGALTD